MKKNKKKSSKLYYKKIKKKKNRYFKTKSKKFKKKKKILKLSKNKVTKKKNKYIKKISKKFKNKKNKNNKKKISKISKSSKQAIIQIIRFKDKFNFNFNFNLDQYLQNFFQGITNKINSKIEIIKLIIDEEKDRKKQALIKNMQIQKVETIKKIKLEKQLALQAKEREFKDEIKLEKERKKELQKFIRIEQAHVRKEQAEKQRKFLEQIKLEKKIEQFRKREALEIKNLEKFVLGQERDSYSGVQERIDRIKQKYQALRDQKIRERVEALGVQINEGDDRSILLEKERQYNEERQKIEFALESFYRSAHSLCFQINKRYIPKYLSILRIKDLRFESGEIYIKWDESSEDEWLILIYIKNNTPDEGIVIEDKTNPEKTLAVEFQSNEIFKASDFMVDSLTKLLDRERQKRKNN